MAKVEEIEASGASGASGSASGASGVSASEEAPPGASGLDVIAKKKVSAGNLATAFGSFAHHEVSSVSDFIKEVKANTPQQNAVVVIPAALGGAAGAYLAGENHRIQGAALGAVGTTVLWRSLPHLFRDDADQKHTAVQNLSIAGAAIAGSLVLSPIWGFALGGLAAGTYFVFKKS